MRSQVQRSQIDSQNFDFNHQKNEILYEKKSVSSFQEKNITIQVSDKILNNSIFQTKEFLQQDSPQEGDKTTISIIQTEQKSVSDQNKNLNQIQKQFNQLKFDSKQKIQNIYFNNILIKFLHLNLQNVLTFDIKNIIRVQRKLDDHLIYMKNMRNKLLGLSFKEIKRKMWSSSQANLSATVFRQIVFIAPHFYETKYSHLVECEFPYLIRLPSDFSSTEERNFQFKKLIFSYIVKTKIKNNNEKKDQKEIQIPLMEKQFFKQKSNYYSYGINEQLNEKKADIFIKKKETPSNFSPFNVLNNSSDFKESLYLLIRQKQMKIKQMQKDKVVTSTQ